MKLPSDLRARPIHQMPQPNHARARTPAALLVAATVFVATGLHAQAPQPNIPPANDPLARMRASRFSGLPATQPTSLPTPPAPPQSPPAANTLPAPIAATPVSSEQPSRRPRRAQVTYLDGQLNVRADDSSLNQILRAISRQTGLKITGGVADQRVFGDYGPASTASILATLLDGTDTNILLLEGDATTPPELILTPRGGGPTPPSPSSPEFDDAPDPTPVQQQIVQQSAQSPSQSPATTSGPPSIPQPFNNVNGSPLNTSPTASTYPTTHSVPLDSVPTPSTTPSTSGIVDAPNPPAPGSTTGTAPNGNLTPEQVYQLLKQRQKQQNPPANPPTAPAPQ